MNKNAAIVAAAVVGLGVGIAIGMLMGGGSTDTEKSTRGRGGGAHGPTPSMLGESLPEGTWGKIEADDPDSALDVLDQIQDMAITALEASQITPQMFTALNDKLLRCAVNDAPHPGSESEHRQLLISARMEAQQGNWPMTLQKMTQHGH